MTMEDYTKTKQTANTLKSTVSLQSAAAKVIADLLVTANGHGFPTTSRVSLDPCGSIRHQLIDGNRAEVWEEIPVASAGRDINQAAADAINAAVDYRVCEIKREEGGIVVFRLPDGRLHRVHGPAKVQMVLPTQEKRTGYHVVAADDPQRLGMIENWMQAGLEHRDDGPSFTQGWTSYNSPTFRWKRNGLPFSRSPDSLVSLTLFARTTPSTDYTPPSVLLYKGGIRYIRGKSATYMLPNGGTKRVDTFDNRVTAIVYKDAQRRTHRDDGPAKIEIEFDLYVAGHYKHGTFHRDGGLPCQYMLDSDMKPIKPRRFPLKNIQLNKQPPTAANRILLLPRDHRVYKVDGKPHRERGPSYIGMRVVRWEFDGKQKDGWSSLGTQQADCYKDGRKVACIRPIPAVNLWVKYGDRLRLMLGKLRRPVRQGYFVHPKNGNIVHTEYEWWTAQLDGYDLSSTPIFGTKRGAKAHQMETVESEDEREDDLDLYV